MCGLCDAKCNRKTVEWKFIFYNINLENILINKQEIYQVKYEVLHETLNEIFSTIFRSLEIH